MGVFLNFLKIIFKYLKSNIILELCSEVCVCFSGSDVVDWLFHHVEGFADRREARKYASNLLKAGFIRHTVNKITFSEQCYYVFGDLSGSESPEHAPSV